MKENIIILDCNSRQLKFRHVELSLNMVENVSNSNQQEQHSTIQTNALKYTLGSKISTRATLGIINELMPSVSKILIYVYTILMLFVQLKMFLNRNNRNMLKVNVLKNLKLDSKS